MTSKPWKPPESMFATIPADLVRRLEGRMVCHVGMGAGPSFICGTAHRYDPPVSLEEGVAWLDQYASSMKRGHVYLDDGTTLWFTSRGFERHDIDKSDAPPRRTVTVATTDGPVDITMKTVPGSNQLELGKGDD